MVFRLKFIIFLLPAIVITIHNTLAQGIPSSGTPKYETVYDDPYDIHTLYIMANPVYGEVFSTNTTIGYGLGLQYYLKELFDFQVKFRTPYAKSTDFIRDASRKNSDALNAHKRFYYVEGGLNYHVYDRKESTKSKFVLFTKSLQRNNRWMTMVPKSIYVPSNTRKIYGIRLGGTAYQSTIDVNKIIENQGNTDYSSMEIQDVSLYSSMTTQGLYVGGSFEMIKNIAISFEDLYDQTANDLIFSVFLDFLINPAISIMDIQYVPEGQSEIITLPADIIDTNKFGFRGGIMGKFNRKIGFGYCIETGMRPGIKGNGFYVNGVFYVPVFGFRLDKSRSSVNSVN